MSAEHAAQSTTPAMPVRERMSAGAGAGAKPPAADGSDATERIREGDLQVVIERTPTRYALRRSEEEVEGLRKELARAQDALMQIQQSKFEAEQAHKEAMAQNSDRILAENGWQDFRLQTMAMTPRRFGKTTSVSMFAAACCLPAACYCCCMLSAAAEEELVGD